MLNQILKTADIARQAGPKLQQLKKATEGIEGLFMKDLLASMRRGTPKGGLMGEDGTASKIYKDMFDQTMADNLSKSGALGIGKVLYRQLSKQVLAHLEHGQRSAAVERTKPPVAAPPLDPTGIMAPGTKPDRDPALASLPWTGIGKERDHALAKMPGVKPVPISKPIDERGHKHELQGGIGEIR